MKENIIVYYGNHCKENCNCSYCVNRRGITASLQKLGYQVSINPFSCDWDYYYPTKLHFDYAIRFHNKIFGSLMFEANKFPKKVVEFVETYLDHIICASKFLKETWVNGGIETKYLLSSSFGLDTEIFNIEKPTGTLYPGKFKFLSIGAWQPGRWQDRKGLEKLMQIFKELFNNRKDIMLIIKTNKNAPENLETDNIKIIRDDFSDKELAELYKICAREGAYVHLHKGEGFGKTLLEACYCGCRIGTTGWSGPLDFLDEDNATLFNYKFIDSIIYSKDFYSDNILPKVADVDEDEVKKWMVKMVKEKRINPNYAKKSEYTWDNIIENLMIEIKKRL